MTGVAAPELLGSQMPTLHLAPAYTSTAGAEAVQLAAAAGLLLDPWQQDVLRDGLGERVDGMWAAFEVGVLVARQNGKGGIFEARVLAGLFLLGERLIMYSAHEFKTAAEMFRRILALVEGTASMRKRVKSVSRSKGDEGIELTTGQRLRFVARSKGSGRGFSGDCNILDEAQILDDTAIDALMPTMSARPNPQLWYGGTAGDKDIAPCEPLARLRKRVKTRAAGIAYAEWSAELCDETCRSDCDEHDRADDPAVWAKTNPALGRRISVEYVARELEAMGPKGFARERLSVGNWPSETADQWAEIPEAVWRSLQDAESRPEGRVVFAVDATPGGTHAAIGVAGVREDGLGHSEVVDHRRGTGWVVERAVELKERWSPPPFVLDPGGPAGHLIPDLEAAGVEVFKTSARDVASATGGLIAACGVAEGDEATVRFMPHPALDAAVAGAVTVPLGDGKKWNRKSPSVDISPLVAVTLARHGLVTYVEEEEVEPWAMFG